MTAALAGMLLTEPYQETLAFLDRLGAERVIVAEEFAERLSENGRSTLRYEEFRLDARVSIRIVRIDGGQAEVLNVLFVPEFAGRLPTLVAEWLVVGGVLRVAFLDLQTPGMEPMQRDAFRTRRAQLFNEELEVAAPEWATRFSSGRHVFRRPNDVEAIEHLTARYRDDLNAWAEEFETRCDPAVCHVVHETELAKYKQGHIEHTPVLPFLERVFQPNWSRRFVRERLYR